MEKSCKPIKCLDELLRAVAPPLRVKPEKRSAFDVKVIEQMQKALEVHAKTFDGKIAALEAVGSSDAFKTKVTEYDARIKEVSAAQKEFKRVASGAAAAEVASKAQEEKVEKLKQFAVDSQLEIVNKEKVYAETRAALESLWSANLGLVSLRDSTA